jgi:hypothetical protein
MFQSRCNRAVSESWSRQSAAAAVRRFRESGQHPFATDVYVAGDRFCCPSTLGTRTKRTRTTVTSQTRRRVGMFSVVLDAVSETKDLKNMQATPHW